MSFIITPDSPTPPGGGGFNTLDAMENGSRGPLRHFLIGSPQRIRATIRHLQALRYVDHTRWTELLYIDRDRGLLIRPTAREMYAYLQLPQGQD